MRNRWFLFSVDELKVLLAGIKFCAYKIDGIDSIAVAGRLIREIEAVLKEKDADL